MRRAIPENVQDVGEKEEGIPERSVRSGLGWIEKREDERDD